MKWLILLAAFILGSLVQCTPDDSPIGQSSTNNEISTKAYLSTCPKLNQTATIRLEFYLTEQVVSGLFCYGHDHVTGKIEGLYGITHYIGLDGAVLLEKNLEPTELKSLTDTTVFSFEFKPQELGEYNISGVVFYHFYDGDKDITPYLLMGNGNSIDIIITSTGCNIEEGSSDISFRAVKE